MAKKKSAAKPKKAAKKKPGGWPNAGLLSRRFVTHRDASRRIATLRDASRRIAALRGASRRFATLRDAHLHWATDRRRRSDRQRRIVVPHRVRRWCDGLPSSACPLELVRTGTTTGRHSGKKKPARGKCGCAESDAPADAGASAKRGAGAHGRAARVTSAFGVVAE
jgi:hypothetical protein